MQEAPVSGNLDSPEGGLDAMMQAMICTKEIGWRQNARHFIVFSTDANFHIAGDGRVCKRNWTKIVFFFNLWWSKIKKNTTAFQLAGIIEPNDCLCHLDSEGFYTHSLLQDYPSISQVCLDLSFFEIFKLTITFYICVTIKINKMARENNMNIIFAVTSNRNETYQLLSRNIRGSSIGTIERNSKNVVALVSGEYEVFSLSINFRITIIIYYT